MGPRSFLSVLHGLAFLSGAASLADETAWARMLVLLTGNTVSASALIAATFMAGLCAGSWTCSRRSALGGAGRAGRRLGLYAALELCLAAFVWCSPFSFGLLQALLGSLPPDAPAWLVQAARTASACAFLFLPAFLMGAAYPALVEGSAAEAASSLYAVNTVGAAAGALAAGLLLLPTFGIRASLGAAGCAHLLAGAAAWLLGRRTPRIEAPARSGQQAALAPAFISLCAFAAGFAALSHQVLMTRLAILFLGSGIAVFPTVLAAFLLGTGLSAWFASREGVLPERVLPGALCALLACGGLTLGFSPFVLGVHAVSDWGWMGKHEDLLLLSAVLLPSCLIGGILPLGIRLLGADARGGSPAGRLYALNSLGGALGAAAANVLLVPRLGVQGTLAAQAGALLVLALVLYRRLEPRGARRLGALSGAAACWATLALSPAGLENLYLSEISKGIPVHPLLHREGRAATITVVDFPTHRELFLNGMEEVSTRPHHLRLFKLLGILPGLLAEGETPREGFMIAFGAGVSAGAALQSGTLSSLDVADVNGDIGEIAGLFREHNGDCLSDPRLRFHEQDGRDFLVRARKRYGIIIADSTHPLAYDSWLLYTREFYELARRRLAPDGAFALWVPLTQLSEESLRILIATFLASFPEASLWNIPGSEQSLLLAGDGARPFDVRRVQERLDRIPASVGLREHQLDDALRLASNFAMGPEELRAFAAGEKRLNTDDLPHGQRSVFRARRGPGPAVGFSLVGALPPLTGLPASRRKELLRRAALAAALRRYYVRWDPNALAEAFELDPDDRIVRMHCRAQDPDAVFRAGVGGLRSRLSPGSREREEVVLAEAGVLAQAGFFEDARALLLRLQRASPGSLGAREGLARILPMRRAQDERIRVRLLRALEPGGQSYASLETEARQSYIDGRYDESARLLGDSLREYPGNTLARINLSDLLRRLGRGEEAQAHLRRVLEINPFSRPARRRLGLEVQKDGRGGSAAADLPEFYPCGEYCRPWEESWIRESSVGM